MIRKPNPLPSKEMHQSLPVCSMAGTPCRELLAAAHQLQIRNGAKTLNPHVLGSRVQPHEGIPEPNPQSQPARGVPAGPLGISRRIRTRLCSPAETESPARVPRAFMR